MQNDPIKTYYELGYASIIEGRKRRHRVPVNYKCAYGSGRYDAVRGKPSRYEKNRLTPSHG